MIGQCLSAYYTYFKIIERLSGRKAYSTFLNLRESSNRRLFSAGKAFLQARSFKALYKLSVLGICFFFFFSYYVYGCEKGHCEKAFKVDRGLHADPGLFSSAPLAALRAGLVILNSCVPDIPFLCNCVQFGCEYACVKFARTVVRETFVHRARIQLQLRMNVDRAGRQC